MTENAEDIARATAEEHSKPGKFNFLDRLASRNYPTEDVVIFLDEAAGHRIEKLATDLSNTSDSDQAAIIEKQIDALAEKARESRYVVHLRGISVEAYDATVDEATAMYPLEYRETRHPLTMELERYPVESEGREIYFRTHLWAKYIESVEAPDGSVDDNISPQWVAAFLNHSPIVAQARIKNGIEQLRMVTGWMDQIQGEDFLAKS